MSVKQLNFKIPVAQIDGTKHEKETLADVLAMLLAVSQTNTVEDVMKIGGWWKSVSAGEPLSLDTADIKKLRDTIVGSDRVTTFVKVQLLDVLEEK